MECIKDILNKEIPKVYEHIPTGISGVFVKEYKPTGRPLTMQIKLIDERIYFAPKKEFQLI